jgi:2-polyprenyl-6-methoxyphenol hydroxylase-like FAD-dependent oxidoreductase
VLAGELAAAAGHHPVAFTGYENTLRDYVKQCQDLPPGGTDGFLPRTRMAIWLRNQSTRMMGSWPWRSLIARTFQKADAITLKDYAAGSEVLELSQLTALV